MQEYSITIGEGRTEVAFLAKTLGSDITVYIYNFNAHIGAVAVGEYDERTKRTSTSVITRLGHKEDAIAQKSAYIISKKTKKPSCVIVGIHLDNITKKEIKKIVSNAEVLVDDFLSRLKLRSH